MDDGGGGYADDVGGGFEGDGAVRVLGVLHAGGQEV